MQTPRPLCSYLIIGTAAQDVYYDGRATFVSGAVLLDNGETAAQRIPLLGSAVPRKGEKVAAQNDLGNLAGILLSQPYALSEMGGGGVNTAVYLAGLGQVVYLVETGIPPGALVRLAAARGIHLISLGLARCPVNLVLVERDERTIVKSPATNAPPANEAQLAQLTAAVAQAHIVIINSAKPSDVIRHVAAEAARLARPLALALTPSLPVNGRAALLAQCDLGVTNLYEFAQLAQSYGITCPESETTANLRDIAAAQQAVAHKTGIQALVVTLGQRGCVTYTAAEGATHVALQAQARDAVQQALATQLPNKNGVGDRFLGALVQEWQAQARQLVPAAQRATLAVVPTLAPTISVQPTWITTRRLAPPALAVLSAGRAPIMRA